MENFVMKIKHIILGTYYNITNKRQDIAYPRLQTCSRCESNKVGFGFGNYCDICGCLLKSKTTVSDETCPIGKW